MQRRTWIQNSIEAPSNHTWLLLAAGDSARYGGNDGYDDEVTSIYEFDSTVANHNKLELGDVILIWDKTHLKGISTITSIKRELSSKNRYRCPKCGFPKIRKRLTKSPTYCCGRATCKFEFETPNVEKIEVTKFRLNYEENWIPLVGLLSAKQLRTLCISPKSQQSIRRINKQMLMTVMEFPN